MKQRVTAPRDGLRDASGLILEGGGRGAAALRPTQPVTDEATLAAVSSAHVWPRLGDRVLSLGSPIVIPGAMAASWAAVFGWLAVQRHLAGGSRAEDLGFTDQVLGNFLRGQWFRMSIYQGATWNTELDISRLARPDSLLAFHFEPMLLLLVPLYALGGGVTLLLLVQAVGFAAGAMPAYRLGLYATGGQAIGGLAVASAYLLSPIGQSAVLADFHTSTLAAPLLLFAVERLLVACAPGQALIAAGLAVTAREDVGLVVAALGVAVLAARKWKTGLALAAIGLGATVLAVAVVRSYSGGLLPFDVRYGSTLGSGIGGVMAALIRPGVLGYLGIVGLSGGWLGLFSPSAMLPALPSLAINTLSTSPWMLSGKAHYSALVLPFIAAGAAAGLSRLRHRPTPLRLACAGLVLTSGVGYALEGVGPLGGNYAPATVTEHAQRAAALSTRLPPDAAVSASSSLVPRISNRPRIYVFPAVLDADYVFLDIASTPAPTSAGDVFLRVRSMLGKGGWQVDHAQDGLLLLRHIDDAPPVDDGDLANLVRSEPDFVAQNGFQQAQDTPVTLVSAELRASPDGAIEVDGPRGVLHTVWRPNRALPSGTRLEFWIDLTSTPEPLHVWDVAAAWWNPPERWRAGELVRVDVPNVPMRQFRSWRAEWTSKP